MVPSGEEAVSRLRDSWEGRLASERVEEAAAERRRVLTDSWPLSPEPEDRRLTKDSLVLSKGSSLGCFCERTQTGVGSDPNWREICSPACEGGVPTTAPRSPPFPRAQGGPGRVQRPGCPLRFPPSLTLIMVMLISCVVRRRPDTALRPESKVMLPMESTLLSSLDRERVGMGVKERFSKDSLLWDS